MDTVNINRVPVTKTFALACVLDLWQRLSKGSVRLIKPPLEKSAARALAADAFYAKDWAELNKSCFGYSLAVSQADFEKARNESAFEGKALRGSGSTTTDGVTEYELLIAEDFAAFRRDAERYVKSVEFQHLPRSRSLKKGLLVIEFEDEKMLDFLTEGLAWETNACQ